MKEITPAKQAKFLACLYNGHSITKACALADIPRRTVYYWKEESPEFADMWLEAQESAREALEDELRERAFDREDSRSYILLMFLLKKLNPEYRDNYKQEIKVKREEIKEFDFSPKEIDEAMSLLAAAKGKAKYHASDTEK